MDHMKQYNKQWEEIEYHTAVQETERNTSWLSIPPVSPLPLPPPLSYQERKQKCNENCNVLYGMMSNTERNTSWSSIPPVPPPPPPTPSQIALERSRQFVEHLKEVDPKLEQPENKKVFLEKCVIEDGAWHQDVEKLINGIGPVDFYQLLDDAKKISNSNQTSDAKGKLLNHATNEQLTYYLKEVDPKLEQPENKKVFLERFAIGNGVWNQEVEELINGMEPVAFYQLLDDAKKISSKVKLLDYVRDERLTYYLKEVDPKLEQPENKKIFLERFVIGNGVWNQEVEELINGMEPVAFYQLLDNLKEISSSNQTKGRLLDHATDEQLVHVWEQDDPGLKSDDNRRRFYEIFYSQVDSRVIEFVKNIEGFAFYSLINDMFLSGKEDEINKIEKLLNSMPIKKTVDYLREVSRSSINDNIKVLQTMSNNFFYQSFINMENDYKGAGIPLLYKATSEQIEYFFENDERINVLKESFKDKKEEEYTAFEEEIMWRADKEKNSNHENNISKFYGKDLWKSLKRHMESCEKYYNASPKEEAKKKEREKLREGYQKTLALWNLYKDKIQKGKDEIFYLRKVMNYNYLKNEIYISRYQIKKGGPVGIYGGEEVIFHEIGHFIDYQYDKENNTRVARSRLFKEGILWDNARQDFLNMFSEEDEIEKDFLDNFENRFIDQSRYLSDKEMRSLVVKKIEEKIQDLSGVSRDWIYSIINLNESYGDIRDIFENVTSEVIGGSSSELIGGHGSKYWAEHTHNHTEIFAEMFSATLSNWKSAEQIIRFFPTAYDTFLEMVTGMIEESNSQTIDFLKQNPTADEFMSYIQAEVTSKNSLVDLYGLCDNSPQIGNQVKSMIASWDKETFLSYFYTEKCYHSEVLSFLEKYSSEEQRNYMAEKKEDLKADQIQYWKELLKTEDATDFIKVFHREMQLRGEAVVKKSLNKAIWSDETLKKRITTLLENRLSDDNTLQQFLEQNPTAEEFISYLRLRTEVKNSLDDLWDLCDNNTQIESKIKSIIASVDKETFLRYFFMETCYHSEVLYFLENYASKEQESYKDEKDKILMENQYQYWNNLLAQVTTIEELIENYNREWQVRGTYATHETFANALDDGDVNWRIKTILSGVSDKETFQRLFRDENGKEKNRHFLNFIRINFSSVWKEFYK